MTTQTTDTAHRVAPALPAAQPGSPRKIPFRSRLHRDRWLLLFAVPGITAILLFSYIPLLGNVIAFEDYQPYLGISGSTWTGLANFSNLFNGNPDFANAVQNTLIITTLQVLFVFPTPICLALMLNSLMSERVKRVVQSILYLPHFMSWIIVVAIFQQMLGNAGLVTVFLQNHGHDGLHVIGNPGLFKLLLILQVIWKDTGWGTILFLAALSRIDIQLYEASAVDGASRLRQLWHVTLPGIMPVIVLVLILRLGDILSVGFEQIILQQPAVGAGASEVLDTYVYNHGILDGDWGASAAAGLVKGVIGFLLIVGANKVAHMFGQRGIYQS